MNCLFSLHIGKSPELHSHSSSSLNISRCLAVGDIRTHIRVPGGVFAVSIFSEDGKIVYGAVNAGPMEANGQIAVRWKVPEGGRYRAVLWKQHEKAVTKVFGSSEFEIFIDKKCTKVTEFGFTLM
jgi:hypothetical protein